MRCQASARLLSAYRNYILSKVSKVRILGDPEERELQDVFVELSIVDQHASQNHPEFLGMMPSMRRRFNPFADAGKAVSSELLNHRKKESKHYVKPSELLRRRTKVIITGAPGCGKTTLLKYLTLQAQEKEKRFVVWLELKAIDKSLFAQAEKAAARNGNLILQELWLRHLKIQLLLSDAETKLLRKHWQERFQANEIAVFLDGFDELQDEAIERSLNKCVLEFASALHDNTILISTRPYAQYKLGKERLQEFEIEPLNQHQIAAFLNCYYPVEAATKILLKTLRERSSLRELLHVPLLLGVILRLHRENRFTDERLELYETIIFDLIRELDRSKSVGRRFKINDERLRLDFLKVLAFEQLLRDPLDEEERETNWLVFNYDLLREKARMFLAHEHSGHQPRDLADDVLATPLLREISVGTFAFTHLTLQEYLAARALAVFYNRNKYEGLKTFCHAYHNPIIVEMEVLAMMLGITTNADKIYAEFECWSESLSHANLRLQLRGLIYGTRISDKRLSQIIDRVLEVIAEGSAYCEPIIRSLIGIKGRHAKQVINRIASLLDDEDAYVQSCAACALGQIGGEQAAESLVKVLRDKSSRVELDEVEALGKIGSEKAVDFLIETFKDSRDVEDGEMHFLSATALGRIGNEKAISTLIGALNGENTDDQCSAASALGEVQNDKVTDALIRTMSARDTFVRWNATKALGRIGNDRAADVLIKALKDEESLVRTEAATALGVIRSEQAIDGLIKALHDEDYNVRSNAANALGQIGSNKPVEVLIESLTDKDGNVRLHAAEILGQIGNDRAIDSLIEALHDKWPSVQIRAAESLGRIGSDKGIVVLIERLTCEDSYMRMDAAKALGQIRPDNSVVALIEALHDKWSPVRREAAIALGRIGNHKAIDSLIEAVHDEDGNVRFAVIETLEQLGSEKAVGDLIKCLTDKYMNIRERAALALGQLKEDGLSKTLEQLLISEDHFIRCIATQTVGYYSLEPRALVELSRLAETDPVEEIRIAAAEAKEIFARKLRLLGHCITEDMAQPLIDNESRELYLIGEAFRVAAEAGHIFRPTPNSDWGIDGEIEFKNVRGEASAHRVYLQLKSGESYLRRRKRDGQEVFNIKPRHAEYWLSHAYPVLLVIRGSGGQIRWMDVTEYLRRKGTNIRQIEFQGEPFTAESVKRMHRRFARKSNEVF